MFHRSGQRLTKRSVPPQIRSKTSSKPLPAPTLGWVSAQNHAAMKPGTALVMENWFPTTTGIRLIGGSLKHATVDTDEEPVESLMAYIGSATRKLLASCDGDIFDITSPSDPDLEETALVENQTSDYYSYVNFATAGGNYLTAVNGTDNPLLYDGTEFFEQTGQRLVRLAYDAQSGNFTVGQVVTGGTSGATGTLEYQTDAGATGVLYLRGGAGTFQDNEALTDPITGAATANGAPVTIPAITGSGLSSLASLSHVSVYRNRMAFVEGGSMNVWLLDVDSISGALTQVSLAGIFKLGGAVLFTGTWSLDSGDGLDDKFVVVSTEGEVAVYEGSDPSDPNDWRLVGAYEMPPPLGKNASLRAGGDLIILTEQGAIPVSQAIVRDRAALALSAISRNIQPDWIREATARRTIPWEIVKWPSHAMTLVTNPVVSAATAAQCFIVNSETGAWCLRPGWDARCFALHNNQVYFGTSDGKVMAAEVGGTDDGASYVHRLAFGWDHLGSPGAEKTVVSARGQFKTSVPFTPQISVSKDYTVSFPTPPNAAPDVGGSSLWDVGLWDVATWDTGSVPVHQNTRWLSIGESGYALSVQVQVTSGSTPTPDAELVILDVLHEGGEVMI